MVKPHLPAGRNTLAVSLFCATALLIPASAVAEVLPVEEEPAATLLLPYFEVDIDEGKDTLFEVNATPAILLDVEVYAGPSGETEYLGDIGKGTQVQVLGCENDFCHIIGGGYDGWVYDGSDYNTLN